MSKVYTDKTTGERVSIIKEDDSYITLEGGVKIKKETFSKRYEPSGVIDPDEFLNTTSAIENLAKKLMSVDPNKIQDGGDEKTRIKIKPPVVLADSQQHISPTHDNSTEGPRVNEAVRQKMLEEFAKKEGHKVQQTFTYIDDDDNVIEYEMPKPGEGELIPHNQGEEPIVPGSPAPARPISPKVDPLQMMFNMFKNNYDVTINLKIEDKIANPQFIAMVMENVEGDPIEYYAKIILEKVLKEPLKLKKEIYDQLKKEIYGEQESTEEPKK